MMLYTSNDMFKDLKSSTDIYLYLCGPCTYPLVLGTIIGQMLRISFTSLRNPIILYHLSYQYYVSSDYACACVIYEIAHKITHSLCVCYLENCTQPLNPGVSCYS